MLAIAALLIAAQALAAAHVHQKDLREVFSRNVQVPDTVCALCLFHSHFPTNPGTPPPAAHLAMARRHLTPAARAVVLVFWSARIFSRAPPASL